MFSGTLKATVTRNANPYATKPAHTHPRYGVPRDCQAATPLSANAPMKLRKNTGFWMTSLMLRITSTNSRSSLRANAGMIAQAKM